MFSYCRDKDSLEDVDDNINSSTKNKGCELTGKNETKNELARPKF